VYCGRATLLERVVESFSVRTKTQIMVTRNDCHGMKDDGTVFCDEAVACKEGSVWHLASSRWAGSTCMGIESAPGIVTFRTTNIECPQAVRCT
jgi:hypothetical protein